MDSELDRYLISPDALKQSAHLDDTAIKPGDDLDGFTAVALIGRGASCEVWRVHDEERKRDFALKLFLPDGRNDRASELRERFLTEARLLASIRHPNLVRADRSGTFRGEPYFTMELLRPLPARMRPRQIVSLGLDLCQALEHLHSLALIHRDIKPDNVLVAPDGHYVLADLGIVRINDPALSQFARGADGHNPTIAGGKDRAIGTPGYAAPEQLAGQAVTPATDIHALGVLFDTLFEHRPPFCWKLLIRRMTSTIPAFRYSEISRVRRGLMTFKYRWFAGLAFGLFLLAGLGGLVGELRQPKWINLPPEYVEHRQMSIDGNRDAYMHITLPGSGDYTRGDLIRPPWPHYDPKTDTTTYRRRRVVIQGPGRFYAPHIAGADVQLISNVTLVTSAEPATNAAFRMFFPKPIPVDTNGVSMLLPTFRIDQGSKLIREQ